ncbi:MAG: putative Znf/thioredoxin_put domain-containing protein [Arenicellales bacterium IbO2]|nr:zinc-ribbon and DUF3426 domain-containing protein [Gammaproteobacteria bacterium]MDA8023099.1 zinc-ribbon and DUF3426 domain-containing protein [Gammaproteobacteria bacterium]CAJ2376322.1 MAG: putative Znf/thioredoxin_put domain-containing protein [Arenicellales bacterium IbO2]
MILREPGVRAACPHCRAVFTVSQAQFNARGGLIRCDDCGEVFDATWHLAERPQDAPPGNYEGAPHDEGESEHEHGHEEGNESPAARPEYSRTAGAPARGAPPPHDNAPPHDAAHYIAPRAGLAQVLLGAAAGLALVVALVWQVKGFFIDEYAQHEQYRRHLAAFCKFAGCKLPPRRASARITMMHTDIQLHPREPNAMRIIVKLVNEARFAQPYPDLQLTLTDRNGRVVGRRAFAPETYLQGRGDVLQSGELGVVHFDLARPHGKAVGFVVEVVSRS